jgi:uncharacterized protein YdhG (YjbR/CyaY superfamily)
VEKPTTLEQYMSTLPGDVRDVVQRIHDTIHDTIFDTVDEAVSGCEDCISYAIPAVKIGGKILMYYSGWKAHVSVYPIPPGSAAFEHRIAPYVAGKGTLKFPLSKPIPYELIAEIAAAHLVRLQAASKT